MEDAFGAFGDSDSDSEQSQADKDSEDRKLAQILLQAANSTTIPVPPENSMGKDQDAVETSTSEHSNPLGLSRIGHFPVPPSWQPPLYVSPDIQLVSNLPLGGGRGYLATRDLAPGALVLVETPIMVWPDEQLGEALTIDSVVRLFHHENASQIVHCLEDFHPTKQAIDDSTKESEYPEQVEKMMETLQRRHQGDKKIGQLVGWAQQLSLKNRDGSRITETDVLRIRLALQYNGLESGLYCHVAMLNHAFPSNCAKFLPEDNSNPNSTADKRPYSEVRTTRLIRAGESLTISYLPRVICHASRRQHLWEQHRFDIGVEMTAALRRMETIKGGMPPSSKEFVQEESIPSRVERSLEEMTVLYETTKSSISTSRESWEQAKAMEVTALELYQESKKQLENDNHLLLIPCLVLHLDTCDLVLRHDAKKSVLTAIQRCRLLSRLITSGLKLAELQKSLGGNDHFDVARTYLDLSQALEELLAKAPNLLTELDAPYGQKSFRDWSTLEYQFRMEHERIKALYPRDADSLIRDSDEI